MAKHRKSRRRKNKGTPVGDYFLIFVLISILTAIAAGVFFLFMNKEEDFALNSIDLCPKTGARATVALLLDTTDEISATTKQDIQNRARQELKNLPRFYRLSLYKMNDEGLDPTPIVTLCNPGQLTEMDDLAQKGITANPRMIQVKYNDFSSKISTATDRILNSLFEGQQSPLLGALQELSLVMSKPVNLNDKKYPAGRNKIIYITDLMEHTDTFSVYKTKVDLKAFQDSRATEKFGKNYKEDLDFWVIKRGLGDLSTTDLMKFWGKILIQEFGFSTLQNLKMYQLSGEL